MQAGNGILSLRKDRSVPLSTSLLGLVKKKIGNSDSFNKLAYLHGKAVSLGNACKVLLAVQKCLAYSILALDQLPVLGLGPKIHG